MENNLSEREIVNRVASSGLITLDLEDYYHEGERVVFDLKPMLYRELILKEKEFRQLLKEQDWSTYQGKNVAVTCTADAIVPTWAFMLVALHLEPHANTIVYGGLDELENRLFQEALSKIEMEDFRDAKVIIKGCSKLPVPTYAYVEITRKLRPFVSSLMFGEACSTVPLYKKPKGA
jgi:hypothetical protein